MGAASVIRRIGGRGAVAACGVVCGGSVAGGAAAGRSGVCVGRIGGRWRMLGATRVVVGVVGCIVGVIIGWFVGRLVVWAWLVMSDTVERF